MRRREFVRALMATVVAGKVLPAQEAVKPESSPAWTPTPWKLGLNSKTPMPQVEAAGTIATSVNRFFTPKQMATLERLSDLLVPSLGQRPGALQAETPAFIDFLIGTSSEIRKELYTGGLDWLEAESQTQYKVGFASLNSDQAGVLIRPWLRTWMTDSPPTEPHADFINIANSDIREATVNSKVWSKSNDASGLEPTKVSLYWEPIEVEVDLLEQPHVLAAKTRAIPLIQVPDILG